MINKNFLLIFLFLCLANSCTGLSDAKKVLKNEKVSNTDEFLVKKRAPLVLPPQFDKIPSPNEAKDKVKEENEEIKKLLKSKNEDESGKTKHSSVEDRIINIINK